MKKIIFIVFIFSGLYAQCEEYNQFQCSNDDNCNWVEDIEIINCSTLPTYGWGVGSCDYYYPDCYEYLDYGGSYGSWSTECGGGTVQIDNSYCEEIQMPEPPICSDIDTQEECSHPFHGDGCQWVEDGQVEIGQCSEFDNSENGCNDYPDECYWDEDITYGSCSGYSQSSCDNYQGCYWDCSWWYSWACSCYGTQEFVNTECVGEYESTEGICEEIDYLIGDMNFDGIINIQDIIQVVNLILNQQYNDVGDMNSDGIINVIDAIQIINIILNMEI